MPKTYTEIRAFCGLSGHYRRFIRNFACIARTLYDLLGNEVKMGPVTLTPEGRGGSTDFEREDHVSASIGVPRLQQNLSCWKQMHPRKDWKRCCHKSRMMDVTILWRLAAGH